MTPEEAREQVRLRLKSMAEHPGGSMEELTESIMALFYLLSPGQDLGRALIPPASEPLAEGWAWPLEPAIDEYGNRYFCVYLDGRHSESDYRVTVYERKPDEVPPGPTRQ